MRSLRRFLEEADLPVDVRFHDLRHTAGTLALRQGVPLHTVSRMLGYSDPAMTLRRYAHVLDDMRDDAAGRWTNISDPNLDPNITQLRATRVDGDSPEIPFRQGIIRHDRIP
jgi:Phage integrase family